MPATEKTQEGKYKSHPDKWTKRDLQMLDRLIDAQLTANPLNKVSPPLDLYDDLRIASLASWVALTALKTHLAKHGRKL